jgi:subtilisin family serine protease
LFLATPLLAGPAAPAFAAAEPDVIRQSQWHLSTLKLTDVHKRSTGSGITVAVVDSGVDGVHPDLTGQVLPGGPETSNNDFDGRGTALAGLIAGHGHSSAAGGTDAGILGVAPGAKVLPVAYAPISGESGGDPDRLATGIELAISRGANIICVARASVPSERLQFAIEVAVLKGVLVVTADTSAWPASYPGVLTAIPTDSGGLVRTLSSSGRSTGIAVPGEGLMAPHLLGGYRQADAPAAAAAVLAGSAAVLWSASPDAKADQIVALLRKSAADAGLSGPDMQYGAGKIDLTAALNAGVVTATPTSSATPQPGKTAAAKPPAVAKGTVNPLVHSRELGRWLVLLPVLLFFGGFAAWAFRKSRSRVY